MDRDQGHKDQAHKDQAHKDQAHKDQAYKEGSEAREQWLQFPEEVVAVLDRERFHHPHPRVRRKMWVVYLKSQSMPHSEIARLTGVSENTVRSYLMQYEQGGVEALTQLHFYRRQSELMQHADSLQEAFRQHPPKSLRQAAATIEQLTGLRRSIEQVRDFLHHIGFKHRRVRAMSKGGDPKEQWRFL